MYKIATTIDQDGVILNHAILEEEDIPFYETGRLRISGPHQRLR